MGRTVVCYIERRHSSSPCWHLKAHRLNYGRGYPKCCIQAILGKPIAADVTAAKLGSVELKFRDIHSASSSLFGFNAGCRLPDIGVGLTYPGAGENHAILEPNLEFPTLFVHELSE